MPVRGRRAGKYARSQARKQYIENVRANGRLYAVMFASVYVATFVVHHLWPREFNDVFVGAMLVVPLWIVSLVVAGRPGSAAWARGADAEEWTSTALRRALGRQYVIVHDTQLGAANIDHVAVGPAGIFVIETKWSGERWASPNGTVKINTARKQATDGARRVRRALEAADIAESPRPVVVVWGGGTHDWTETKVQASLRGDVPVVPGAELRRWASALAPGVLDPDGRRSVVLMIKAMNVERSTNTA